MDAKTRDTIVDDLLIKRPKGPAGCILTYTLEEKYDYDSRKYREYSIPNDLTYGYGARVLFKLGFRSRDDVEKYIRDRFFDGKEGYQLRRKKSTVTRRTNRIWDRVRHHVEELQRGGGKGIYQIKETSYTSRVSAYLHALNPEEAKTLAELFLPHPNAGKWNITFVVFGDAIRLHEYNNKIRRQAQRNVEKMKASIASATQAIEDVTSLMTTLDTLEGHQIALDLDS